MGSFGGTQGRLGGNRPPDGTTWNRVGLWETCPQGRLGVYTQVLKHEFLQFRFVSRREKTLLGLAVLVLAISLLYFRLSTKVLVFAPSRVYVSAQV